MIVDDWQGRRSPPKAVEDLASAATWYEDQSTGLGEQLVDEVIQAIGRAQDKPDLFRILRLRDGMRRVLTHRFPYRIFFSVAEDTIYVHAILHGARHESHWRNR